MAIPPTVRSNAPPPQRFVQSTTQATASSINQIGEVDWCTNVATSEGIHPISSPPIPAVPNTTDGDLFVHAYLEGSIKKFQIWFVDVGRKSWVKAKADLTDVHPTLKDHRLKLPSSPGQPPTWVTKKTASMYKGRENKQARALVRAGDQGSSSSNTGKKSCPPKWYQIPLTFLLRISHSSNPPNLSTKYGCTNSATITPGLAIVHDTAVVIRKLRGKRSGVEVDFIDKSPDDEFESFTELLEQAYDVYYRAVARKYVQNTVAIKERPSFFRLVPSSKHLQSVNFMEELLVISFFESKFMFN
ncbi:hypothetical protein SERLADRAFT_417587 [Serpula lacrymans var. lacrymans S7.9]|uniref:Uncharacterized protein n=1 Tax=Serpula lacrymans var. lacrymans (strain S7.9) TaxID=578457 RepID=F8P721_SERL9|nr:uncharacterized protein SERLADRAFT_417587 [Serpula lacrymans var. lacrymans S7.9]EGO21237.1 hypothetical protein SERLADRAFT_417587 [Serpula lacrymans var. lacrymans S7.9]